MFGKVTRERVQRRMDLIKTVSRKQNNGMWLGYLNTLNEKCLHCAAQSKHSSPFLHISSYTACRDVTYGCAIILSLAVCDFFVTDRRPTELGSI